MDKISQLICFLEHLKTLNRETIEIDIVLKKLEEI